MIYDMDNRRYAYEYELNEWKRDYHDTDGEVMDDQQLYWHVPSLFDDGDWIEDDEDSINAWLDETYGAGHTITYGEAVSELKEYQPMPLKNTGNGRWKIFIQTMRRNCNG
ncbi:hypothetical protein [Lentilactobacillus rapi]|uniref:hypothetical protein n=1 Tax=Lentilactobacillus rapi TaxID=481723 RepID=UPI0006D0A115|nr:hypothetical protein [Lentilactobacillus rapi]